MKAHFRSRFAVYIADRFGWLNAVNPRVIENYLALSDRSQYVQYEAKSDFDAWQEAHAKKINALRRSLARHSQPPGLQGRIWRICSILIKFLCLAFSSHRVFAGVNRRLSPLLRKAQLLSSIYLFPWADLLFCDAAELAEDDHSYIQAVLGLAVSSLKRNHPQEALGILYGALFDNVDRVPQLKLVEAYCYMKLASYDNAETAFRASMDLSSSDVDEFVLACVGMAELCLETKRHEEAMSTLDEVLENGLPVPASFWSVRAALYLSCGEYQKAAHLLAIAQSSDRFSDGPRIWTGLLLLDQRFVSAALRQFVAATLTNPWNARAWAYQGITLIQLGQYRLSAGSLKESLVLEPQNALAMTYLAVCVYEQGRVADAFKLFNELEVLHRPRSAIEQLYLGIIYIEDGMFEAAIEMLNSVIAQDSENAVSWAYLAVAHASISNAQEASHSLQQAVLREGGVLYSELMDISRLFSIELFPSTYIRRFRDTLRPYRVRPIGVRDLQAKSEIHSLRYDG